MDLVNLTRKSFMDRHRTRKEHQHIKFQDHQSSKKQMMKILKRKKKKNVQYKGVKTAVLIPVCITLLAQKQAAEKSYA